MKKLIGAVCLYFLVLLLSVHASPAASPYMTHSPFLLDTLMNYTEGLEKNIRVPEGTAGFQEPQYAVDKQNFIGFGILVGINTFTDSGLRDIYSPMNVYIGAAISARHKNFVLEAAYEPVAKNRVGHFGSIEIPSQGAEARAWAELDVNLFSTALLYTVPIASRSLKPYFGGGLAFYSVFERITAQTDQGDQEYKEINKTLTGFQAQAGVRFYAKNLESKIELKYGSAKSELIFDKFNYGGLTLVFAVHYGFDF